MSSRFPMRRCWATRFLWPMVRGVPEVVLDEGQIRVKMGRLGGVTIDVANVARLSRMNWPWWGGLGARLGRRMVAYTASWGEVAVIEVLEPVAAKAPLRWTADRVILGVEDVDGFLELVAEARRRAQSSHPGHS